MATPTTKLNPPKSYSFGSLGLVRLCFIKNAPRFILLGTVGDACTGTEVLCGDATGLGPWWDMTFMYGHHQFSTKLYDEMITKCTEKALKHSTEFPLSDGCNDVLDRIHQAIGGYYSYALYDDCTYSNGLMSAANKNGHVNWRYERDER